MYKSKTNCKKNFLVVSEIDNTKYELSLDQKNGTTPMGLLNVALSGCVIMCVKGYYLKKGIKDLEVNIENVYENEKYVIDIYVEKEVDEKEKQEVLEYIKLKCSVSKMLKESVILEFSINKV